MIPWNNKAASFYGTHGNRRATVTASAVRELQKSDIRKERGSSAYRSPPETAESLISDICGTLPIRRCIQDVLRSLDKSNCLVLQAPPGAGKTTTVPLALMLHRPSYLKPAFGRRVAVAPIIGRKIVVLEPRRVAAKAAARRMAATLGEEVGKTVGYRVRTENCVSQETRIEVMTEGVLIRRLQHDRTLRNIGAIMFDEFHERNLDSDLAFALCLEAQQTFRPDLRLVVMSATLGGGLAERVASLMEMGTPVVQKQLVEKRDMPEEEREIVTVGFTPIITSQGRSYPVEVIHVGDVLHKDNGTLVMKDMDKVIAGVVMRALEECEGDVLVFTPGVGFIRSVHTVLVEVAEAFPSWHVSVVVDCGLRKSPLYNLRTGVNALKVLRISKAAADQRTGRAGRTGPGVCYRLWAPGSNLPESTAPEIMEADLAPLMLDLSVWGRTTTKGMPWIDPPSDERVQSAVQLLQSLGAVDDMGRATEEGKRMATFGVHPRFAHMILRSLDLGFPELGTVLASLLSERDIIRQGPDGSVVDSPSVSLRLKALAIHAKAMRAPRTTQFQGKEESPQDKDLRLAVENTDYLTCKRLLLTARSMMEQVRTFEKTAADRAKLSEEAARMSKTATADDIDGSDPYDPELLPSDVEEARSIANKEEDDVQQVAEAPVAAASSGVKEALSSSSDEVLWSGGDFNALGLVSTDDEEELEEEMLRNLASIPTAVFTQAWVRQMKDDGLVAALVALTYPDRLARVVKMSNPPAGKSTRCVLSIAPQGRPAVVYGLDKGTQCVAISDVMGLVNGPDMVFGAAVVTAEVADKYLSSMLTVKDVPCEIDRNTLTAVACRSHWLGDVQLIRTLRPPEATDNQIQAMFIQFLSQKAVIKWLESDINAWGMSDSAKRLLARDVWLRGSKEHLPRGFRMTPEPISLKRLAKRAHAWIKAFLLGVKRLSDVDIEEVLRSVFPADILGVQDDVYPLSIQLGPDKPSYPVL
ncbi:hypothetical protein CEUSTIGMA_g13830.t1 [Chlamydomonas eustigma]|uniref:Helicase ATP-binding domain-containing protein n=1 Tax=Chlamydomonas eustigma TaxID=1157962 RepID=A0A250XUE0_9CHLO|nr:hypothetical protein CEUSTIGMA_g13830.t1 [Chlamydomonas eustigma]|eukprot:GAX86420.1 hypothetical protein CEUSTIGMA_g13830.t1 [Chlamydomonas eustigma]